MTLQCSWHAGDTELRTGPQATFQTSQNGGDHDSLVFRPRLQVDLQAALAIQQDKHLAKWPGPSQNGVD